MAQKSKENNNKILVILGSTATGKSELAVKLALRLNSRQAKKLCVNGAEIISADSRQVYKGLDIGTGKIKKKEMREVPHHMLNVVSHKKVFSVAEWQKQTKKIISDILSQKKLPIICGGTGFYIQSVVENIILPKVPPNKELRKKLGRVRPSQLFKMLKKMDPERVNTIDEHNPVRLIRAIEIATTLGKVPPLSRGTLTTKYEFLKVGLTLPDKELKSRIHKRLLARIKKGMIREAEKLHKNGLSWKRMSELGLEYRYMAQFLQKKLTKSEFLQKLETEIWHYAKRQKQWFKRDKKIKWYKPTEIQKIEKVVKKFLE